jgi:hypothetical protein
VYTTAKPLNCTGTHGTAAVNAKLQKLVSGLHSGVMLIRVLETGVARQRFDLELVHRIAAMNAKLQKLVSGGRA